MLAGGGPADAPAGILDPRGWGSGVALAPDIVCPDRATGAGDTLEVGSGDALTAARALIRPYCHIAPVPAIRSAACSNRLTTAWELVAPGVAHTSAASPATWGAAIDVPWKYAYAWPLFSAIVGLTVE